MHRSSIEMVDVVASEGDCKLVCDPDAWMISWLQAVSYLNAQNRLWTMQRLMGELNTKLDHELDMLCERRAECVLVLICPNKP